MNEATAKRLGDKLANLDLTEDEGALLHSLLGGTVEGEVSGFAFDIEEVRVKYLPAVQVGYQGGDWFVADSFSFGVEREMR